MCWVLEWSGLGTLGAGVVAGVRMSGTALAAAASMAMPSVRTEDKLMRQMYFKNCLVTVDFFDFVSTNTKKSTNLV